MQPQEEGTSHVDLGRIFPDIPNGTVRPRGGRDGPGMRVFQERPAGLGWAGAPEHAWRQQSGEGGGEQGAQLQFWGASLFTERLTRQARPLP